MNDGLDDREGGGEGEGDSSVNSAGGSHALHFATNISEPRSGLPMRLF